ncbi:RNA polymerase sigma factor [Paenibacillus sp. HB172176]|uniref:RNA polymerase sigma factor n=1 Tax=Paenibacillus sp. HB172176 TaxID=2493690 RepID=UPI001439B9D5|nr:RNA polymerase sigma factor [Paenibacillus sp. HB172176]
MTVSAAKRTIEAIWRMESPKLIAGLARMVRDVGLAEDFAQDALVIAMEKWPELGIPDNPGAWLMTAAKRRALDYLRRSKLRERKYEEIGKGGAMFAEDDINLTAIDGEIDDDLLRLIFTTCHPALSRDARVALTLRVLGGLTTDEIARAFHVAESTIAQRIVRAKKTLSAERAGFEAPTGEELHARLAVVLEVIYLMFNEGYSATSGGSWIRPTLCQEALRLGRILTEIAPRESEVHGLTALMEIQSSRFRARTDAEGNPVLLLDQNRALWDHLLIRRGLAAIERAQSLGQLLGPYALQASIAACHARAGTAEETNWPRIAALYEALLRTQPSPIIALNRAVAIGMAFGPEYGLQLVDELSNEPSLIVYSQLPSARGDLLAKLGRMEEAREQFEHAASLTRNERERQQLEKRAKACAALEEHGEGGNPS